jgi:tRNA threonylcarbamoyladenosine biosynthesis protein TsaB
MPDNSPSETNLVVAMDTSGDVCSVAVAQGGSLVSEHIFRHGMHLSERLLDHVTAVLSDANLAPSGVDLFAVGLGPGSFTGTRIGVMTMKTFASLLNIPIYGIDSMAAMARAYNGIRETLVAPMHPCRAGTVYTGLYDVSSGEPEAIRASDALTIAELAAAALSYPFESLLFCGTASLKYRAELETALGDGVRRAIFGDVMFPRASDIAAMASTKRRQGVEPDDALALVPHYVSPPPITMPKMQGVEGRK